MKTKRHTNRQKERQTTYKQTEGKTNRHFKMDGTDILVIMVVGLRVATEISLIKIVLNQNNRHLSPQISTIVLYMSRKGPKVGEGCLTSWRI